MKAQIVQPEDIAYIWDQVAPLLERTKEHSEGELETDDFLEPLLDRLATYLVGRGPVVNDD